MLILVKQTDTLHPLRACMHMHGNKYFIIHVALIIMNRAGASEIITTFNHFQFSRECMTLYISLQNSSEVRTAVSRKRSERVAMLSRGECRHRYFVYGVPTIDLTFCTTLSVWIKKSSINSIQSLILFLPHESGHGKIMTSVHSLYKTTTVD